MKDMFMAMLFVMLLAAVIQLTTGSLTLVLMEVL